MQHVKRWAGKACRPAIHLVAGALIGLFSGGMEQATAQSVAASRPSMGKTVKVGQAIYELAISESTGKLYVASAGGEPPHVAVLDSETLDIETTIPLADAAPYGLGINDRSQTLYTTNTRDGSVTAIDLTTNRVIRHITSPLDSVGHLREAVIDEEANRIYASSYGTDGLVWVIDGETNQVIDHFENVGEGTSGLALDAEGGRLYATNIQGGDISVIDLASGEVIERWAAGGGRPTNATLDLEGERLFVANQETADITVLSTRTGEVLHAVPTGAGALGVRYNPGTNLVYVANRQAGTVTVIDASDYTVVGNFKTGSHPNTVVIDATTNTAYVTNKGLSGGRGAPPIDDPNGDTVTIIRP